MFGEGEFIPSPYCPHGKHSLPCEIKALHPEEWDKYSKILLTRHPWEWVVSLYFFRRESKDISFKSWLFSQTKDNRGYDPKTGWHSLPKLNMYTHWVSEPFMGNLKTKAWLADYPDLNFDGRPVEYDHIIQYDKYDEGFSYIWKELIGAKEFPHPRRSSERLKEVYNMPLIDCEGNRTDARKVKADDRNLDYTTYYDSQLVDLIAECFAPTIALFDYKPPQLK